jgi:hypothetical protein
MFPKKPDEPVTTRLPVIFAEPVNGKTAAYEAVVANEALNACETYEAVPNNEPVNEGALTEPKKSTLLVVKLPVIR